MTERLTALRLARILAEAMTPQQARHVAALLMEHAGSRQIPRARRPFAIEQAVRSSIDQGASYREAAAEFGLPLSTTFRIANS